MKNKKWIILSCILLVTAGVLSAVVQMKKTPEASDSVRVIAPMRGDIRTTVSTTGNIEPKNRLELIPTVAGRIDRILVEEGDSVRAGQIVAWMSSSDRAALIDAARSQGESAVKYWEDTYKAIPLVSPITGTVIVRSVEPGQTVTTSSAVIVISDRLIVMAQLDETDIGRVAIGKPAVISLDSHPDIRVKGKVTHISYESETVNNV
ncbi:MAG: efflux RND transporter periplasmic adaptor subunit, partial [Spirochaetota bacterium]